VEKAASLKTRVSQYLEERSAEMPAPSQ